MNKKIEEKILELYIHIPFCVRKCIYCDFLSFPAGQNPIQCIGHGGSRYE